ncbi:MAG: hypothetical protein WCJ64_16525 [Rhodospirillaceae bacterium]
MVRSWVRGGAAAVMVLGLAVAGARAEVPAVTSDAASALTNTLDTGLRQWLPSGASKAGWRWSGRPLVTPAGDHYDVDLPALTIAGDDGSGIQVGVVKLTLTPQADGSWMVGLTVPSRILMVLADGKSDGEMTIGSQRFSGRWLPALGTFVTMDGEFGTLVAASAKDHTRLEVGKLAIRTDLAEQPPGRWSGPGTLTLNGVAMVDEHGAEVARIGSLAVDSTMSGVDLAGLVKIGNTPDAQHHPELLRGLIAAFSAKLAVGDTTMTAANDGSSFTVKELAAHGGIEGLDGELSSVTFGYKHGGLTLKPSPGPAEFIPDRGDLDLALTSLPNAGLWAAVETVLKPAPGQTDEQTGTQFAQTALTALTQAGSRLVIKSLALESPAAAATVKGSATFDGKAGFGLVAGIDVVLRGIDAAVKRMQPAPGAKVDEDTQQTLAAFAFAQALGAPGKDEAGRDLRTYKLELGPDGRILLNGADMSTVLTGVQGRGAKP